MSLWWRTRRFVLDADGTIRDLPSGAGEPAWASETTVRTTVWDEFPHAMAVELTRNLAKGCAVCPAVTLEYTVPAGGRVRRGEARLRDTSTGRLVEIQDAAERPSAIDAGPYGELAYHGHTCDVGVLGSAVAHQVSQPLTATLANAEVALQLFGDRDPRLGEALRDIVIGQERLVGVVQMLRQRCGLPSRPREPLDLNAIVRDVVRLAQRETASRGVAMTFSVPDRPAPISGNRCEVQQLVLQLVINACEAAEASDHEPRDVVVRSTIDDHQAVLTVADSGDGVSDADFARMYEPFFTTKHDHVGLGLTTAQHIASAHSAVLRASRNPDAGMTFSVTFASGAAGHQTVLRSAT